MNTNQIQIPQTLHLPDHIKPSSKSYFRDADINNPELQKNMDEYVEDVENVKYHLRSIITVDSGETQEKAKYRAFLKYQLNNNNLQEEANICDFSEEVKCRKWDQSTDNYDKTVWIETMQEFHKEVQYESIKSRAE